MIYLYDKTIFCDIQTINKIVLEIIDDMKKILADDLCFDVRLILSELLINSYEHGNKCDKNKRINLYIKVCPKTVHIEVSDEGCGINILKPYILNECKPNGRGLLIVKALVDNFEIKDNKVICDINIGEITV